MIVETRRSESPQGLTVDAHHDGYVTPFGAIHHRRMTLSPRGASLAGADRLIPAGPSRARNAQRRRFAIRFHIHPDVRLSLAQGGGSVILKLPNGEGWRFRCGSGTLSVEERRLCCARRSAPLPEQLVVTGEWHDEVMECAWLFEQVGPA